MVIQRRKDIASALLFLKLFWRCYQGHGMAEAASYLGQTYSELGLQVMSHKRD